MVLFLKVLQNLTSKRQFLVLHCRILDLYWEKFWSGHNALVIYDPAIYDRTIYDLTNAILNKCFEFQNEGLKTICIRYNCSQFCPIGIILDFSSSGNAMYSTIMFMKDGAPAHSVSCMKPFLWWLNHQPLFAKSYRKLPWPRIKSSKHLKHTN